MTNSVPARGRDADHSRSGLQPSPSRRSACTWEGRLARRTWRVPAGISRDIPCGDSVYARQGRTRCAPRFERDRDRSALSYRIRVRPDRGAPAVGRGHLDGSSRQRVRRNDNRAGRLTPAASPECRYPIRSPAVIGVPGATCSPGRPDPGTAGAERHAGRKYPTSANAGMKKGLAESNLRKPAAVVEDRNRRPLPLGVPQVLRQLQVSQDGLVGALLSRLAQVHVRNNIRAAHATEAEQRQSAYLVVSGKTPDSRT